MHFPNKHRGSTLKNLFQELHADNICPETGIRLQNNPCYEEDLRISTKIPPWQLTSVTNIRERAKESRQQLLGFCDDLVLSPDEQYSSNKNVYDDEKNNDTVLYPLDVYYIHAPKCWQGWHPRCNSLKESTLPLKEAWLAMEAVVGIDQSATRIGLSNVNDHELLDIIQFVQQRQKRQLKNNRSSESYPPPRMPDVLQSYADPLRPAKRLRQICEKYNIEFVSYSTLGTQHRSFHEKGINPVLSHPTIQSLAYKYKRSTAEVVLSWAMASGMSVIPRSKTEEHIEELANMLHRENVDFLSEEDLKLVDAMSLD